MELCMTASLMEVRYHDSKYTWCNNRARGEKILARLDKALMNWNWLNGFGNNTILQLSKVASDHKPILFIADNVKAHKNQGKNFTFEHYWFDYYEVDKVISDNWCCNGIQADGMANYKSLWMEDILEINCSYRDFAKSLNWKRISKNRSDCFCKEFTAYEMSLGRGKSPEPDGYNVEFFVKYWHILGSSIVLALKEFYTSAKIPDLGEKQTSSLYLRRKHQMKS
ncbi:reverse transcriptase [Canna indica]|uniref:Reverse transcriptase n=1 Tax=Canna indica TaxID=4628 RepID=A0AAQ3KGD8_9LILI|nr:reverse transcriptase [Canna indica]